MDRLQSELQRLYLPQPSTGPEGNTGFADLVDPQGRVRALVLELARPADWAVLARVWTGVQADLGLPAPAIAVSGTDALQLWFSLAEMVNVAQARLFLESLRTRYWSDVESNRVNLLPALGGSASEAVRHAPLVPAAHAQTGQWSAFVSADLAPIFADSPWMDVEPSSAAQAGVLSRLQSIGQAAFAAALAQIGPDVSTSDVSNSKAVDAHSGESYPASDTLPDRSQFYLDPRQFLLQVMNNTEVSLALRIEAARALLSAP